MKKILIVDDLEPFIRQERTLLDRSDFMIFTAKSSEEAIELHRRERVDLILADLNMPGISGDQMTSAIRLDPDLRYVSVMIICSQKKADMEKCAACGANDFITRPLDAKKLMDKISRLLEIPQRRNLRVLIKVSVKGTFDSAPFFGTTHNISVAGLLLESDKVLAKGDRINCVFYLPDSERVSAESEIIRVIRGEKTFQYGVKFLNVGEQDRGLIEAFVKKASWRQTSIRD